MRMEYCDSLAITTLIPKSLPTNRIEQLQTKLITDSSYPADYSRLLVKCKIDQYRLRRMIYYTEQPEYYRPCIEALHAITK